MAGTRRVVAWLRMISRSTVRFWKGEYDVTTLRSVPSWGVSFLLHALLLLILAFIIQIRHAPAQPEALFESSIVDTEIGEVTSLAPAKQSGDPFTLEQNLNPPSIGLEPEHSGAADDRSAPPGLAHAVRADPGRPVDLAGHLQGRQGVGELDRADCPTWRRRSSPRFRADRV